MTKLLEQAIARAKQLPESEQDAIAKLVLEEIESERQWDRVLAKSPEKLSKLADKAWAEHEAGDCRPAGSPLEVLDALQASLQLTAPAATDWAERARAERQAFGQRGE